MQKSYSNWLDGEPAHNGATPWDCMISTYDDDGSWSDSKCTTNLGDRAFCRLQKLDFLGTTTLILDKEYFSAFNETETDNVFSLSELPTTDLEREIYGVTIAQKLDTCWTYNRLMAENGHRRISMFIGAPDPENFHCRWMHAGVATIDDYNWGKVGMPK